MLRFIAEVLGKTDITRALQRARLLCAQSQAPLLAIRVVCVVAVGCRGGQTFQKHEGSENS